MDYSQTMNMPAETTRSRAKPRQKRAEKTVALILDVTADLLDAKGFDKVNTNLICKKAGLSPPALYRYFPNKYSVLRALGERLLDAQNRALFITAVKVATLPQQKRIPIILRDQIEVTKRQIGAAATMRAIHATPILNEVLQESHQKATDFLADLHLTEYPDRDPVEAVRRTRIAVEIAYCVIEMAVTNPNIKVEAALEDTARAIIGLMEL